MIVQLSVTSYIYHLVTQDKVNNRLLSWLDISKTESTKARQAFEAGQEENHRGSRQAGKGWRRVLLLKQDKIAWMKDLAVSSKADTGE